MAAVRERWLSNRALSLHAAALVLVPGCAVAAWWQVNRAEGGNQLSYFYSVMWPVFGLLALYFWWMLVHTDYEAAGLKGMRRNQALGAKDAQASSMVQPSGPALGVPGASGTSEQPDVAEDPELAAYNARLAALAAKGPKTWRSREDVVVRRAR